MPLPLISEHIVLRRRQWRLLLAGLRRGDPCSPHLVGFPPPAGSPLRAGCWARDPCSMDRLPSYGHPDAATLHPETTNAASFDHGKEPRCTSWMRSVQPHTQASLYQIKIYNFFKSLVLQISFVDDCKVFDGNTTWLYACYVDILYVYKAFDDNPNRYLIILIWLSMLWLD